MAEHAAHGGGAQTLEEPLSLAKVCASVLANNPAIKEALTKWDAMKARVPQEASWDDPKISASSRFARFIDIQPNAFMDQSLALEQMIPISGKNRSRARVAVAEALSAFQEARRQELDVLAKTRSAYFRLANSYAQIELNRKNMVSLKELEDITRSKYEVGNQGAADVLVAETDTSKLLETGRDLEQSVAAGQSQLNVLMNRDAFVPLGRPASAPIKPVNLSIDRLRELTLANRPEVLMALAKVSAAKASLELARRQWIPDPSISVEGQRYNGAAQAVSELDAGISFSVPWVNYRKYSAAVREANDNLAAARQALEGARKEAVGMLRNALQKAETAHHHVELFQDKLLPQARSAFEASQTSYQSGKGGFLEWITAQRNIRDLESMGREHLSDYQTAVAELESVVGTDLKLFTPFDHQTNSTSK